MPKFNIGARVKILNPVGYSEEDNSYGIIRNIKNHPIVTTYIVECDSGRVSEIIEKSLELVE